MHEHVNEQIFLNLATISLINTGHLFSWGDGDYGKLGRGGSEGCKVPKKVEIPPTATEGSSVVEEVVKVYCGAQSSFALVKSGAIFSWGKGDLHRLGHGSEEHVRWVSVSIKYYGIFLASLLLHVSTLMLIDVLSTEIIVLHPFQFQ